MEIIAIKITCRDRTVFPRWDEINRVCGIIEKSNLYVFLGKSRIDGFPIYKPKVNYIRLGKIQKLKGTVPNIYDKYDEVSNLIEGDIDIIPNERYLEFNF